MMLQFFACLYLLALAPACTQPETSQANAGPNLPAATTISSAPSLEAIATSFAQDTSDEALSAARRADRAARGANGALPTLTVEEHMRRAAVYAANRVFRDAREHWGIVIQRFPSDSRVPAALFGTGRSFYQERNYTEALHEFERLGRDYAQTREGRDGFYYVAPTLLRMNRASDAVTRYIEYTERFPTGERIENAYLNIIDTLREANRAAEVSTWVERTRARFPNMPTANAALFARLRMHIANSEWQQAINTADELRRAGYGSDSMMASEEISYLRAYSLERAGQTGQAITGYVAIPDRLNSYYGALATARLTALNAVAPERRARAARVSREISTAAANYPIPYRDVILRSARGRNVDPRLVLAIMRQESGFRPRSKSGAGARGLMQFTIDTANRYAPRVGLNDLQEEDLYRPEVSILLACEYIAELNRMFRNMPEAVAGSYNGGEDNIARWLARARNNDPGVLTSEIGFTETKDYVQKVLANYRAYRQLYNANLVRQ